MAKITKPFDIIFDEIVENILDRIEIHIFHETTDFDFCIEKDGYIVDVNGKVGGNWYNDGDGEYFLRNGWGDVENLTIIHYDEVTETETILRNDILEQYRVLLENAISEYMKNI